MKPFHTYQQAVHYLINELPKEPRIVISPEEKIAQNKRIMKSLGSPQDRHPTVHVAGTSGKGTICYLVDGILRAHTKRTGQIQSPHVYDIRERIQINGQLVSERKFLEYLHIAINAFRSEGVPLTYSHILTVMGFIAFGENKIDYAVAEVGIGGRLDNTNAMSRKDKVAVLGQIGYDHNHSLGTTLSSIAGEKAGIVQENNQVIALEQDPQVVQKYKEVISQKHASAQWVQQKEDYQKTNNAMAVKICQTLADRDGWKLDAHRAQEALQDTFIPGRYETRTYKDRFAVLDGAHNPQKLNALAQRLIRENRAPVTFVVSLGKEKEMRNCLLSLKSAAKRIIATEYFTNMQKAPFRPVPAEQIVETCKQLGIEASSQPTPSLALAHAATFAEPIVTTGSFFILGEIDAAF